MTLGIDFGTSNSCAAWSTPEGDLKVVRFGEYDEMLPSCVLGDGNGIHLVGRQAEAQARLKPQFFRDRLKQDLLQDKPVRLGTTSQGEDGALREQMITGTDTRTLRLRNALLDLCRNQLKHGLSDRTNKEIEAELPYGMGQESQIPPRSGWLDELDRLKDGMRRLVSMSGPQ